MHLFINYSKRSARFRSSCCTFKRLSYDRDYKLSYKDNVRTVALDYLRDVNFKNMGIDYVEYDNEGQAIVHLQPTF